MQNILILLPVEGTTRLSRDVALKNICSPIIERPFSSVTIVNPSHRLKTSVSII
jgi:hypothetical protein